MSEIWKDIIGFEGKYQISNTGKVKSLSRKIGSGAGYIQEEMILKQQYDGDGYAQVNISVGNRKTKSYKIHKLVVSHFIENVFPKGYHICHKDGNILNNHVDNLYIGDVVTNTIDRYRHGTTKLSIEDVKQIRLLSGKKSQRQIAEMFGVRQGSISRIINGVRSKIII